VGLLSLQGKGDAFATQTPAIHLPDSVELWNIAASYRSRHLAMAIAALSGWTSEQRHVVAASFLGWSLDAFDFFLLVFVLKDIAAEFLRALYGVAMGGEWGVGASLTMKSIPPHARGFVSSLLQSGLDRLRRAVFLYRLARHLALAIVAGTVAIVIAGLTAAGTEAKGVVFAKAKPAAA
jgi:MFS family permease